MPSTSRLAGAFGLVKMQRTTGHPALEQSPLLQVFDEKGQLAHPRLREDRHRRCRLPFEVDTAGKEPALAKAGVSAVTGPSAASSTVG